MRRGRSPSSVSSKLNWRALGALVITVCLGGCSATALRCGVDGESSFVEIYDIPQNFSQNIRTYTELCGFAYEGDKP